MSDLGMNVRYDFDSHPNSSYPHILCLYTSIDQAVAMIRIEFNELCNLVNSNCYSADYVVDWALAAIMFRTKADAMRIKLMWKPIEWISQGPPAW
jgi:hypothetical protein